MKRLILICSLIAGTTGWGQGLPLTGVFSEIELPSRYMGAAAGHWDLRGAIDLVVVTEDRRLLCYPGRGDGTFEAPVATSVAEALPPVRVRGALGSTLVAVGNELYSSNNRCEFSKLASLPFRVSGSGNFGGGFSRDVIGTVPGTSTIQRVSGQADGFYGPAQTLPVSGSSATPVNVNGDSFTDLLIGLSTGGSQVWLADTKGGFVPGQTLNGEEWSNYRGAADLNGDGKMDLLFEQGSVALGLGNGTFALSTIPSCKTNGYAGPCDAGSVIADFNLDGRNDVVVAPHDSGLGRFEAVFRMGTVSEPELNAQKLQVAVTRPEGLVAGDWNADSAIDLAVASERSVRIYMNMIETRVLPSAPLWSRRSVAPGSLATVKGVNYSTTTATAALSDLPFTLAGVQVRLTDEGGQQAFAPLLYVAPQQMNFIVPESTRLGWSKVELVKDSTARTIGWMEVIAVAPSLFEVVTQEQTNEDGSITSVLREPTKSWTPGIYTFYATGLRGATLNNTSVGVNYASLRPLSIVEDSAVPGLQRIVVEVPWWAVISISEEIYGGGASIETQGVRSGWVATGFWVP